MKFSFCVVFTYLILSQSVQSQPKVYLPEGFYFDLGDVLSLSPTKKTIFIKNIGTDTLIISNVGASCGCTALLLSENSIPPQDSTSLLVTFDGTRFKGKVEKLISFNTNDKDHPLVEVKFSANVINIFQIEPEYIFIKTSIGSPVKKEIEIKNISDKTIKILSANSTVENLLVTIKEKKIPPGKSILLPISFDPKKRGALSGDITIKTDHPQLSSFNIRFHSWTK